MFKVEYLYSAVFIVLDAKDACWCWCAPGQTVWWFVSGEQRANHLPKPNLYYPEIDPLKRWTKLSPICEYKWLMGQVRTAANVGHVFFALQHTHEGYSMMSRIPWCHPFADWCWFLAAALGFYPTIQASWNMRPWTVWKSWSWGHAVHIQQDKATFDSLADASTWVAAGWFFLGAGDMLSPRSPDFKRSGVLEIIVSLWELGQCSQNWFMESIQESFCPLNFALIDTLNESTAIVFDRDPEPAMEHLVGPTGVGQVAQVSLGTEWWGNIWEYTSLLGDIWKTLGGFKEINFFRISGKHHPQTWHPCHVPAVFTSFDYFVGCGVVLVLSGTPEVPKKIKPYPTTFIAHF